MESSIRISSAKPNSRNDSKNSRSDHSHIARNYLYLNYKEAYGLRFDPVNVRRKSNSVLHEDIKNDQNWMLHERNKNVQNSVPHGNNQNIGSQVIDVTTTENRQPQINQVNEITPTISLQNVEMISVSPLALTIEGTTTATNKSESTISNENSTVTPLIDMSSTISSTFSDLNKHLILAFATLLNNNINKNATKVEQNPNNSSSPLRNTLNSIRERVKQWFYPGTAVNAPLISGQRFLSVFNVFKFDNSPCSSTQEGMTGMSGICYPDYQCSELGGISIDQCADGLGVCCICKIFFNFVPNERYFLHRFA